MLKPDFGHKCCEFNKETYLAFPDPLMKEIQTTIFIDSNHGHDMKIGKSITCLIGLLGSTPVSLFAKRQSSVMKYTFGEEFISLKKEIEEAVVYRCYCRSFGMKVTKPNITNEDNMDVATNSSEPRSKLQHECMTLSCHFCRGDCSEEVG